MTPGLEHVVGEPAQTRYPFQPRHQTGAGVDERHRAAHRDEHQLAGSPRELVCG